MQPYDERDITTDWDKVVTSDGYDIVTIKELKPGDFFSFASRTGRGPWLKTTDVHFLLENNSKLYPDNSVPYLAAKGYDVIYAGPGARVCLHSPTLKERLEIIPFLP